MWTSFWTEERTRQDVPTPGLSQVREMRSQQQDAEWNVNVKCSKLWIQFNPYSPVLQVLNISNLTRVIIASRHLAPWLLLFEDSSCLLSSVRLCDMRPYEGAARVHERAERLVPINRDPVLQLWRLPERILPELWRLRGKMSNYWWDQTVQH